MVTIPGTGRAELFVVKVKVGHIPIIQKHPEVKSLTSISLVSLCYEMPFRSKMEEGWFFKARQEDWCRMISLA